MKTYQKAILTAIAVLAVLLIFIYPLFEGHADYAKALLGSLVFFIIPAIAVVTLVFSLFSRANGIEPKKVVKAMIILSIAVLIAFLVWIVAGLIPANSVSETGPSLSAVMNYFAALVIFNAVAAVAFASVWVLYNSGRRRLKKAPGAFSAGPGEIENEH